MKHATLHAALLVCIAAGSCNGAPAQDDDAIVFVDDSKSSGDSENIITPPRLPVIEHLENDPTTFRREDKQVKHNFKDEKKAGVSPKFGLSNGFDLTPTAGGGFSASFSHGFTGLSGGSQAGSHSVTLGAANNGFQLSQSSSQSSSFGGGPGFLGNSIAGSQASSQSASFSGGLNGASSASSAASSSGLGGNIFGHGFSSSAAQSQSSASSIGLQGISTAFGQGSGQSASFPGGESFANGQSSSGAFGNGATGIASGNGFSNNGLSNANSLSLASVNSGPITTFGESSNFGGFDGSEFVGRGTGSIITFPGPVASRHPKVNYRPIPQSLPRGSLYNQPQFRRRRPSVYDWIRVEI